MLLVLVHVCACVLVVRCGCVGTATSHMCVHMAARIAYFFETTQKDCLVQRMRSCKVEVSQTAWPKKITPRLGPVTRLCRYWPEHWLGLVDWFLFFKLISWFFRFLLRLLESSFHFFFLGASARLGVQFAYHHAQSICRNKTKFVFCAEPRTRLHTHPHPHTLVIFIGALNCFLSVTCGAFGAHALKSSTTEKVPHSFFWSSEGTETFNATRRSALCSCPVPLAEIGSVGDWGEVSNVPRLGYSVLCVVVLAWWWYIWSKSFYSRPFVRTYKCITSVFLCLSFLFCSCHFLTLGVVCSCELFFFCFCIGVRRWMRSCMALQCLVAVSICWCSSKSPSWVPSLRLAVRMWHGRNRRERRVFWDKQQWLFCKVEFNFDCHTRPSSLCWQSPSSPAQFRFFSSLAFFSKNDLGTLLLVGWLLVMLSCKKL